MNRRLFFLSMSGLAGCTRSSRPRLNVLNWSDYVAEETIPRFEREFNVRVHYGVFESGEEMLARVMSGNSGWDVVFPANYFIRPMVELGLLARVDHSRLPNSGALEPRFQSPPWDPKLEWCVPYMWGATGIVYQTALNPPVTGWGDLWDQRFKGRLTMLDDPAEVLGAALKKLGYSLNSGDAPQLNQARQQAEAQKPLLRAYANETVRDQVVAGELLAAQAWRSTAMRAIDAAQGRLTFSYPSEGYPLYADNMAILHESRRTELAHTFINYLLRPEVASEIASSKLESTVNAAARARLPQPMRESPILYPEEETLRRGEWFQPLSVEAQRFRDRIWTEIKAS
ncbi:MAG: spermidine/putrescine ABC transporter substrate-binding protein [Bryobacteraceae bacterium]|nr:spermidine/putrescine ABC transporter substrate-binding protein [Bryobacteraceae bacterium]